MRGRCNSGARFAGAARGVISTSRATTNLCWRGALADAIEAGILQPGAPVPHAGAAGGRVAVGCDNFSRGGNPMRHFVTQSVTRIVNNKRVRGLAQGSALGDCAGILRR